MDELAKELRVLRGEFVPAWDDERSARLYRGVRKRSRRRQVARRSLGVGLVLAACGLLFFASNAGVGLTAVSEAPELARAVTQRSAPEERSRAPMPAVSRLTSGHKLRLADGSLAYVLPGASVLDVVRDEPAQVDLRLLSGAAHFEVVPRSARRFVVDAGPVQVAVLGTVFDVARVEGRVRVSVSEGKVQVSSSSGSYFVSSGEARWFDVTGEPVLDEGGALPEESILPSERPRRAVHKDAKAGWRSLSQDGEYERAYRELSRGTVDNDPAALMDAADAARFSGHPDAAAAYLRRVVRDHRTSPVAPLAAFTLGRVLLERLGQPSEAAETFAKARALAPRGSLAQDALAREVEALSKAGNTRDAYLRAQEYVRTYPQGTRLRAVLKYGGLE